MLLHAIQTHTADSNRRTHPHFAGEWMERKVSASGYATVTEALRFRKFAARVFAHALLLRNAPLFW